MHHGGSTVIGDAVALEDVLRDHDFPREPALIKGRVQGQEMR